MVFKTRTPLFFLYILFNSPVKTHKILQFKYLGCGFLINLQSQHISRDGKSLTKNYKAACQPIRQKSKTNKKKATVRYY